MMTTTPLTDLEIAQKIGLKPIAEIALKFGLDAQEIEMYGKSKAKLPLIELKEKV
ncbi:Formate--tetrahydrofolate ligase [Salegentibacter salinarum]|nr:Formate--tetrahydrofolate ligase [Salegentibacter salinarum]